MWVCVYVLAKKKFVVLVSHLILMDKPLTRQILYTDDDYQRPAYTYVRTYIESKKLYFKLKKNERWTMVDDSKD